jgi:prepilin-type N-terminal cleavage/methylation domain-containing protein
MNTLNRGFTLVEMLAALAIGVMLMAGVASLINDSLEDTKGQQAALHQSQVTAAAMKYINAHYNDVLSAASATTPATITVDMLRTTDFLSDNFSTTNAYGQTPCVLVLETTAGRLDALVVTEGGTSIPSKNIAYVAAQAGQGGGYIRSGGALNPPVAQGAFNAWSVPATNFTSTNCSGTAAGADHLASALFFDGPGSSSDYLYRNSVPGHPELNAMTTPLNMRAVATLDTSDSLCVVGDANTYGRIAADATGAVLSCQSGVWKRQGSGFWKDPVNSFTELAALPLTGNQRGDVRLTKDFGRAYSWNGSDWIALAVDNNGNLTVPGTVKTNKLQLNEVVTQWSACPTNGELARDSNGVPMLCRSGQWRRILDNMITAKIFDDDYSFYPGTNGPTSEVLIDVTALPGSRPLFLTGYGYCFSHSNARTFVSIELRDASWNLLGYAGGCAAESSPGAGLVMTKGFVPLQKLPSNTYWVRALTQNGSGSDWVNIHLTITNSE